MGNFAINLISSHLVPVRRVFFLQQPHSNFEPATATAQKEYRTTYFGATACVGSAELAGGGEGRGAVTVISASPPSRNTVGLQGRNYI